jgi:energy-coupling factor transporter ATP-binding protein EcfA2
MHIDIQGLTKTFAVAERAPGLLGAVRGLIWRKHRVIEALRGLSFGIEPGELVGFLGPNGAGKNTTIKILSGILVPDAGLCDVGGRCPWGSFTFLVPLGLTLFLPVHALLHRPLATASDLAVHAGPTLSPALALGLPLAGFAFLGVACSSGTGAFGFTSQPGRDASSPGPPGPPALSISCSAASCAG